MTSGNMTAVCRALGKSAPTIRHYIALGMPYLQEGNRKTGTEWLFNIQDCLDWYEQWKDAQEAKRLQLGDEDTDAEDDAELKAAKLEKIRVETARLELRLAKEQGEVVPITSVTSIVERHYSAVRAQLLALPSKVAPLLAGKTDIQEIDSALKSYLYEALGELQEADLEQLQAPLETNEIPAQKE